jgi:hypothetical protein
MDTSHILKWINDEDEILASLQSTIALLLTQQNHNPRHGGSQIGQREIYQN